MTGALSWRRLGVLVRQLPRDSATARSILGEDDAGWDLHAHLLASLVDVLAVANWQRAGGKGTRPRRIPRPGVRQGGQERHGSTEESPERIVAYLAQFRPKGGD